MLHRALVTILFVLALAGFGAAQSPGDPHYEVTFEGGEAAWSHYTNDSYVERTESIATRSKPAAYTDRAGLAAGGRSYSELSVHAYARGPLKATLHWVGGDAEMPPPDFVIIQERVSVHASGSTTQVDCGLPNATTSNGSSIGYRARQIAGAETIEITCEPAGIASDPLNAYGGGRASVVINWEVDQIVPVFKVKGTTLGPNGPQAVVGQRIAAELTFLFNTPLAPNASYTWSVEGARPFDAWEVSSDQKQATFRSFDPARFSGKSRAEVCFAGDEQTTITWQGDPFGLGPVSITRMVRIIKPQYEQISRWGWMQFIHRDPGPAVTPPKPNWHAAGQVDHPCPPEAWQLFGATAAEPRAGSVGGNPEPDVYQAGFLDLARVWRPGASGDVGEYAHVQLVQDKSKYNGKLNTPEYAAAPVLDHAYPYQRDIPGQRPFELEGPSRPARSKLFADAPGLANLGDPSKFPFEQAHDAEMDQTFQLFLMYRPPWNGLQGSPVPLTRIDWFANGRLYSLATRSAQNPLAWRASAPTRTRQIKPPEPTVDPAHPVWTDLKPAVGQNNR